MYSTFDSPWPRHWYKCIAAACFTRYFSYLFFFGCVLFVFFFSLYFLLVGIFSSVCVNVLCGLHMYSSVYYNFNDFATFRQLQMLAHIKYVVKLMYYVFFHVAVLVCFFFIFHFDFRLSACVRTFCLFIAWLAFFFLVYRLFSSIG